MKRFYATAGVEPRETGFAVTLDGRPVLTPARRPVVLPARGLAEAVAAEWQGQGEEIEPATMPLMRLVTTALDRVADQRADVEADLARFGASDLLCYRAEHPAELVERQASQWQPLVDWAALAHDAALTVTAGVIPVEQPADAVTALARPLAGMADLELIAVHAVTAATGSLVIALALHGSRIDAEAAFEAGLLDELYEVAVWGDDPEAEQRRTALKAEIAAAARLLGLLREG